MNQIKIAYIRQLLNMPIISLKNIASELTAQAETGIISKQEAKERLSTINAIILSKEINIENHKNAIDPEED